MNFGELAIVAPLYHYLHQVFYALVAGNGWARIQDCCFPISIWAPDVYQGSSGANDSFLAVGSNAAGFVLLLRVLFTALPRSMSDRWSNLLIVISAVTILYGNLCALPPTQSETLARLFQHRPCGLYAAWRRGAEQRR